MDKDSSIFRLQSSSEFFSFSNNVNNVFDEINYMAQDIHYSLGGFHTEITYQNAFVEVLLIRKEQFSYFRELPMDISAAKSTLEEKIAKPLGISVEDAAAGIVKIAASGISRAIRSVASSKGLNPIDFSLFAYGGAGPLLGAVVNEEVGSRVIIIPSSPGTICARGILLSDRSFDFVQTVLATLENNGWEKTLTAFKQLTSKADHWFELENISAHSQVVKYYIEGEPANSQIVFCGYRRIHPLENRIMFTLKMKTEEIKMIIVLFDTVCNELIELINAIKSEAEKTFK